MSTLQSRVVEAVLSPRLAAARRRLADTVARVRPGSPTLTLYYQPGDAYSHLCAQLLPRLKQRLDVTLRVVIVPPSGDATNAAPDLGPAYAIVDAQRIAPAWRRTMPADACMPSESTRMAASRVLLAADGIDAFLEAEPRAAAALWRDDADALHELPMRDAADTRARLQANAKERQRRGHYQGGMWYFRGDWYWALDRLSYLEARLRRLGRVRGQNPLVDFDPTKAELPAIGKPETLRFFYSFRSPYSYLAVARTGDLAGRYGIGLDIRPVLPMVMRGFKVPRIKRLYIVRDAKREADSLGVPFGRICDPLGGGVERCLGVFPQADRAGLGLAFLREAGRAVWSQGADIRNDTLWRGVLARAGLESGLVEGDSSDIDYAESNREALFGLGLWGVPSYQLGALTVWGQDRIWLLEEALRRSRRG